MSTARTSENGEGDRDGVDAPIGQVMSIDLLLCAPEQRVANLCAAMRERNVGCAVAVAADGAVAGVFTERDLLMRVVGAGLEPGATAVGDVITREVEVLDATTPISVATELMNARGFRHVPVMRDGKLAGIVSIRDLLRVRLRRLEALRDEEAGALRELRTLLAQDDEGRTRTLLAVNERLQELALTDELTGLYNHRYFRQRLVQEVHRAERVGSPLSLLFVDLDHFKRVNDTFGHPVGDRVLCHVAGLMRTTVEGASVVVRLRKSDVVARYGGEEFAVLLPDARSAGAVSVAERLRAVVAESALALDDGTRVPVTMSIGVATIPDDAQGGEDLLRAADLALYRAKHGGRNRVERAGEGDPGSGP
jgi:diguanylate cyclase (GGDEF)-like protein